MNSIQYYLRLNSIRGAYNVGILSDEEAQERVKQLQKEYESEHNS